MCWAVGGLSKCEDFFSPLMTSTKWKTFTNFQTQPLPLGLDDYQHHYLCDTQTVFIHVAQVEHGLRTVVLVGCDAVVCSCCAIVFLGPVAIVMVISSFHSSKCIA